MDVKTPLEVMIPVFYTGEEVGACSPTAREGKLQSCFVTACACALHVLFQNALLTCHPLASCSRSEVSLLAKQHRRMRGFHSANVDSMKDSSNPDTQQ